MLLAPQRAPDSHLAGGAALHRVPNSKRFSNDLDYFHDSVERVAEAFDQDRVVLEENGLIVDVQLNQPGYIRALVRSGNDATKVEWSHDSSWRFLPAIQVEGIGYQLDPLDLGINKLLALAGRDEPRDFIDILYIHENILPLGALCWAAVGKDPGFSPTSLLELIRRRGKYRQEDFERLILTEPVDLKKLKSKWLKALDEAEVFLDQQPVTEVGCLYYSPKTRSFVAPDRSASGNAEEVIPHYGRPGGVAPVVLS